MLKAIHAQESKKAAREKAKAVVEQLRSMKLKGAAKKVDDGIVIERLNGEICRRTRVVGSFPDGSSAPHAGLCPAAPCGRHPVGQQEVHEHEAPGGCP